jgi:hypothetical protein
MVKARKIKQRGGSLHSVEQSGGFQLSQTTLLLILAASIVICGVFIYLAFQNRGDINIKLEMPAGSSGSAASKGNAATSTQWMPRGSSSNVPPAPERHYQSPPDFNTAGSVFNFPTQGYAESFQQVGLLVAPGGSPLSSNPERTLVPLYGRRTMASRNKWNYYTRTDGLNPVQVPIQYKNRDCDDDNGCDEIYDGDEVSVPAQGQTFKANIYRQKSLVYNPFTG